MRNSPPARLPIAHAPDAPVKTRTFIGPFIILVGIVFASAIQTEVANYLAQVLEFNKPYFSFFVTHVAFAFVFPIHLGILAFSGGPRGARSRAKQLVRNLRAVLADQLHTAPRWRQLARPLTNKIVPLTLLVSFPSICWYVAMALSPAMDITAIYATSAFHTYFFSLLLLGTRLTKVTVAAIAVAFAGVIVITIDDAGKKSDGETSAGPSANRLMGDIIMVIGAAGLGLYEVVYKMVLPESEGGSHRIAGEHATSPIVARHGTPPPEESSTEVEDDDDDNRFAMGRAAGSRTPLLAKATPNGTPPTPNSSLPRPTLVRSASGHHMHVPHLPPAFHSNFLTSAIGVATLVLLWIPFPFLHATGVEDFMWPSGQKRWGFLLLAASMGAIYVSYENMNKLTKERWSHDADRYLGSDRRVRRQPPYYRSCRHRGRALDGHRAVHRQGRRGGPHLCWIRCPPLGRRHGGIVARYVVPWPWPCWPC